MIPYSIQKPKTETELAKLRRRLWRAGIKNKIIAGMVITRALPLQYLQQYTDTEIISVAEFLETIMEGL